MRLAILLLSVAFASSAAAQCVSGCIADITSDGVADVNDLNLLLAAFGTCPGDPFYNPDANIATSSACVDQDDLNLMLANFNSACPVIPPPADIAPDAYQIALEVVGSAGDPNKPTPPLALAQRVDRDVALIKALEPSLATQLHSPKWAPNHLIVQLVPGAPTTGFACLNTFYDSAQVTVISQSLLLFLLTFSQPLAVETLVAPYAALAEVNFAEPDFFIGGQNTWNVLSGDLSGAGDWMWSVDDGFADCFDGCDCHIVYTFKVTEAGVATLVDKTQFGQPWCAFP